MRYQKSTRELEKVASKTYDIRAPWQWSWDLGIVLTANSHVRLERPTEPAPNDHVSSVRPLSEIPKGGSPLLFKQQIYKNQQVEALKDMTSLLTLVTEQEKDYKNKLSPH